ncbi:GNAT family N-acetyltransferase [Nocardioides zeae]|uniref:GNAT family N-acetyltransferase n=1 Tax=Nocardioides zeae TaxID=1457234 RepID=A0A6P0HCH4_9ACTN|nr:GNAT family N-acetyltransferase [Nocardioides zeae]NEN76668.1 GNAT family N-acetyltransferase [Nocardioides zeae]
MVRRLRSDDAGDAEAVGALTVAAYEPFLDGPDDPYVARLLDVARRDAEAEVWVAVDDDHGGTPLGAVTYCPAGSPWREVGRAHEGEFRMLAVAPHAQGRGVGRALVTTCLERSRDAGFTGMALSSLPEQTGGHALYRSMGFERAPERDWAPYPGVDLWVFARGL